MVLLPRNKRSEEGSSRHVRIDWKVQLNVRNIIGNHDPIPITVQPWGETAMARLAPERRWYLTNTFGF